MRDVGCDDGRAEAGDSVEEASDAGTTVPKLIRFSSFQEGGYLRSTLRRRENFRSVCIQDTVHDILEEGLTRRESELEVGVTRNGEQEQEDTRETSCNRHRPLTTDVLDVDGVAGNDRAGDTNDGSDGVVAVGLIDADSLATGRSACEVLGQEGVEEWVAHADREPAEPEQAGGPSESLVAEERRDALTRE